MSGLVEEWPYVSSPRLSVRSPGRSVCLPLWLLMVVSTKAANSLSGAPCVAAFSPFHTLFARSDCLCRDDTELARWREWAGQLRQHVLELNDTLLVATSAYDAAYTHFLIGVEPTVARALPRHHALSGSVQVGYLPGGEVWVVHCDALYGPHDSLSSGIMHLLRKAEITALRMSASEALTRASRADSPGIRALVWLPCDVECASLWPLFAAGIPVAAPSLDLLLEWEQVFVLTVLDQYPSVL